MLLALYQQIWTGDGAVAADPDVGIVTVRRPDQSTEPTVRRPHEAKPVVRRGRIER